MIFRDLQCLHSFAPSSSEVEKPWKTHLEDLPNAAAFAAKAAEKTQGYRKMVNASPKRSKTSDIDEKAALRKLGERSRISKRKNASHGAETREHHRVSAGTQPFAQLQIKKIRKCLSICL